MTSWWLRRHRSEAFRQHHAPYQRAIERLGRTVFGLGFEVELSDELAITHRKLQDPRAWWAGLVTQRGTREPNLRLREGRACVWLVRANGQGNTKGNRDGIRAGIRMGIRGGIRAGKKAGMISMSATHDVTMEAQGHSGHDIPLERAFEVSDIVRALATYGLTQRDIAHAVGVNERTVRNWLRAPAARRHEEHLDGLREVVLILAAALRPQGVGRWLRAPNLYLGRRRALDVLRTGDIKSVRDAATAFLDGDYI